MFRIISFGAMLLLCLPTSLSYGQSYPAQPHVHKDVKTSLQAPLLKNNSCEGTCSANAGGAISICTEETLTLTGFLQGVSDPQVVWTADQNNPASVIIVNDDQLQTVVTASDGGMLSPGQYTFTLTATCPDGTISCNDVLVTVAEIGELAITDPIEDTCEQSVTIVGSLPNPGVATSWTIEPEGGVTILESGNELTVTNFTSLFNCEYDITYFQSIGSCMEEIRTTVSFVQSYNSVNPRVIEIGCDLDATLRGNFPGCGGQSQWTYVSGPTPPADITILSPTFSTTSVLGTVAGEHTFNYTILNGECPTVEESVVVNLILKDSCCVDPLGPTRFLYTCDPFGEMDTYIVNGPNLGSGYDYDWSVISVPDGVTVTLGPPVDEFNVTLNITGAVPDPFLLNEIILELNVVLLENPECKDSQRYRIRSQANQLGVIDSEVFLNCGGDMDYRIFDNLTYSGGFPNSYIVDQAPDDYPGVVNQWLSLNFNTELDLRIEGAPYVIRVASNGFFQFPGNVQIFDCLDTTTFTVYVNDVPTINAGADQLICGTETQLNGNIPLNADLEEVDIPILWEQVSGPPVTFSNANVPGPVISGLEYGTTYEFRYSYPGDPDCIREDLVMVTTNPESECCPIKVESSCENGCTDIYVEGGVSYLVTPMEGILDLGGGNFQVCSDEETTYTFIGMDASGSTCGQTTQIFPGCPGPPLECDFELAPFCGPCGCGNYQGGAILYDAFGHQASPQDYNITWTVNGMPFSSVQPFISFNYNGPALVEVVVTFTQADGTLCTWSEAIAVNCLGDCPIVSLLTCDDAPYSDSEECRSSSGCSFGAYTGPVWVVDQAGDLIQSYVVEWEGASATGSNPYYLQTANDVNDCSPPTVTVMNYAKTCEEEAIFDYDCCDNAAVEIECHETGNGTEIQWWGSCSTVSYQVSVSTGNGPVQVFNLPAQNINKYTIPANAPPAYYSVRALCESGDLGPPANCIYIDDRGSCNYLGYPCPFDAAIESSKSIAESQSTVYPNPVEEDKVTVAFSREIMQSNRELRLVIYNQTGSIVNTYQTKGGNPKSVVEVNALSSGMHYLVIYDTQGNLLETLRFIKR